MRTHAGLSIQTSNHHGINVRFVPGTAVLAVMAVILAACAVSEPSLDEPARVLAEFTADGTTYEFQAITNTQGPSAPCVGVATLGSNQKVNAACPTEQAQEDEYASFVGVHDQVFVVGYGLESDERIELPKAITIITTDVVNGRRFFLIQLRQPPASNPFDIVVHGPDGTRTIPAKGNELG